MQPIESLVGLAMAVNSNSQLYLLQCLTVPGKELEYLVMFKTEMVNVDTTEVMQNTTSKDIVKIRNLLIGEELYHQVLNTGKSLNERSELFEIRFRIQFFIAEFQSESEHALRKYLTIVELHCSSRRRRPGDT